MAQDSQARELCLPSHFLSGHLPLHGGPKARHDAISHAAAFAKACALHFQTQGGEEDEAEEEDRLLAALTRTIARYFLSEDNRPEDVARSASDKGSPNGPSSPPPVEQRKESEHCDLLYEAASQVLRLRRLSDLRRGQSFYAHGILGPARKPAPAMSGAPENASASYYASDPVLSTQQLQAAHFYHLKQQQSMKQPPATAWRRQSTARGCGVGHGDRGRPLDLPPPAWPPLPQPAAMFLNTSGPRKESIGTGVFLPRVASSSSNGKLEPKRKSACSRDPVNERMIRALNLNLEEFAARRQSLGDAEAGISTRSSTVPSHPKNHHLRAQPPPPAAAATAQEILLPQEWTY